MVGIVNQSTHHVKIVMYGHDDSGVTTRECSLEPNEEFILCDSMSQDVVLAFPPEGFIDSALLAFDDTLLLKHIPYYLTLGSSRGTPSLNHCIQDARHWEYAAVRTNEFSFKKLYRPVRRYILSENDYTTALANRK